MDAKSVEIICSFEDKGLDELNNILSNPNEKIIVRLEVSRVLSNILQHDEGRQKILLKGPNVMIEQLSMQAQDELKEHLLWGLAYLATDEKGRDAIREVKGLFPLVSLLHSTSEKVLEPLLWLIINLCTNNSKNKQELSFVGVAEGLVNLFLHSKDPIRSLAKNALATLATLEKNKQLISDYLVNAKRTTS